MDEELEENVSDNTEDSHELDVVDEEQIEYRTLAHGTLSPRHRRLAHLLAAGHTAKMIAEELHYSESRISILSKNPHIQQEIRRIQDRIFEESIAVRMKSFAEPALNNIQNILTDRTNRVKVSEKMALSQWVVEKLDGKATQKHDVGENLLGVLLDKLDAKSALPVHDVTDTSSTSLTTNPRALSPAPVIEVDAKPVKKNDEFDEWVRDFASTQRPD